MAAHRIVPMASKRLPITLILGFFIPVVQSDSISCGASGQANFSVSFSAEWSPSSFPKHYPTYRPPAQWSTLFGCTHKFDFVLWANGSLVSPGVRMFVENGKPQQLIEELEAAEGKVRIPFQADQIPSGEGNTTTIVTMEPSHPFVSIIVRIVPSPDWFVGVSSLNLCENSTWRTRKLLDLYPWDAGTDSGFTFSSPNFETEPQEAVSQITATTPSHPANSFYYPRIKKLPRLGFLEFNLLAVEANHATLNAIESPPINNEQILEECILDGDATNRKNDTETRKQKGLNTEEEFDSSESFTLKEHCGKSQTSTPLDCEVSQWVSWGLCSHFCGNGIRQRTRYITLQPANGGDPCPTLMEKESCEETPCSTDSPATSERLSTTTVILTDSPATSKRPSITPAPSTDSPATSDRPSMTPARSTDSPATSDRPSMTPARSTDSPATSNMPSTTPVHSTDSSATSNRLSMTLADSTDSPATSDKPSTTPAPNKKIFNLKWVPSQESHGALWRRIYHRLLSRTKGFKNTTAYLHSVPTHST